MFVDEKKFGEVQAPERRLGLYDLIAWLEALPRYRLVQPYDFTKSDQCLIAQWLHDRGEANYSLFSHEVAALFPGACEVVQQYPQTFGGALARARELAKAGV
jgi:hypothetical protein